MTTTKVDVRHLLDTDELTSPHWNIPGHRPDPSTTLVATDPSDKIIGLCWMAYGGPAAMIVIWASCEPIAGWPLWQASFNLAKERGCAMMLGHVQEGTKFIKVLEKRGWIINSWRSIAVGRPVDYTQFSQIRQFIKGGR